MAKKRFIETYSQGTIDTKRVIVDTETGVNYLLLATSLGGGITVLVDKDGKPTNAPDEGIQGMVLPMAGFKGYGIAMLIDIMSGVLSGAAYLNKVGRFYSEDGSGMNVGFYMTVIDPVAVLEEYDEIITDFINRLKTSKPGVDGKIILPGDDRIKFKKTI